MIDFLTGLSYCILRTGNLFQYVDLLTFSSSLSVLSLPLIAQVAATRTLNCRKIGWHYSKKEFRKFYNKLYNAGLIGETSYELFYSHFFPGKALLPQIQWHGRRIELIKLFSRLMEKGVIMNHSNHIRIIRLHFSDENGNPLSHGTLKTSNGRTEKDLYDNFITDLINEIKSVKSTNDVLKVVNSRNS